MRLEKVEVDREAEVDRGPCGWRGSLGRMDPATMRVEPTGELTGNHDTGGD